MGSHGRSPNCRAVLAEERRRHIRDIQQIRGLLLHHSGSHSGQCGGLRGVRQRHLAPRLERDAAPKAQRASDVPGKDHPQSVRQPLQRPQRGETRRRGDHSCSG